MNANKLFGVKIKYKKVVYFKNEIIVKIVHGKRWANEPLYDY